MNRIRTLILTCAVATVSCQTDRSGALPASLAEKKAASPDATIADFVRVPTTGICKDINPEALNPAVKAFYTSLGAPADWRVFSVTENKGQCFLILALGQNEETPEVDIVIYDKAANRIRQVKDVLPIPSKIRATIGQGQTENSDSNSFYWEFKGKSVEEIYKNVYAKFPNPSAFVGCVDYKTNQTQNPLKCPLNSTSCKYLPTGKLSWDLTPGRKWKLRNGMYDNSIGSRNEVEDVYGAQLDGDFPVYLTGLGCFDQSRPNGSVAPWQGYVDKIFENGSWKSVEYDERFPIRKDLSDHSVITHTAYMKTGINAQECLGLVKSVAGVLEASPFYEQFSGALVSIGLNLAAPFEAAEAKIRTIPCVDELLIMN